MVFLPISFMDGMVGPLFTEFAVLLAMAVIFSSIIALTLSPVLGSKLLKANVKPGKFNVWVDSMFGRLEKAYRKVVTVSVRYRYGAPLIVLAFVGSVLY